MKITIKLFNFLILATLLSTFNCNNDDDIVTVPTPVITLQDLEVTIDENPTIGDAIGTIESDSNSALTYSIDSQTPSGALNIDENSGELSVADATLFDFETNSTITATVSANGASNTAAVTINLTNIEVTLQDFVVSIDENPVLGQVLGTIVSNATGTSNYSLMNQTPNGALIIDANSGELTISDAALFDFETNPVITASVTDGESVNPATVTINLTNINEVMISTFDESVDENPTNGQVLGTVQSNATGNPNYSIVSQTPAGAISINPNTGEVTVADASLFDYETNQFIDAVIAADDAMDSSDFELQIDNVNELGDFAFGGIIFWIDPASNNSGGLVIAVDGLTASAGTSWGCSGTVTGATGTAIGTGQTNTAAIVAAGCATPGSAAELVSNLDINGYDDWFLPSLDEWNEIDANFNTIIGPAVQANGGGPFFSTSWSSTEDSSTDAFIFFLGGTSPIAINKSAGSFSVRAVRAFTD